MIRSMTGFGRASEIIDSYDISVEIRSVNHRYLELSVRVPRSYSFLEEELRKYLMGCSLNRGKVEVTVQLWQLDKSDVVVEANIPLASGYMESMKQISEQLGLRADIGVSTISRFPDVFNITAAKPDEDSIFTATKTVLDRALEGFLSMKKSEGTGMLEDIHEKLDFIEKKVDLIDLSVQEQLEEYRLKLTTRMREMLESIEIDDNRILLEAALLADRSAVDEEIVRLKSHIKQFREILEADEAVGRKLDFLLQELNREINTIGSKSNDFALASMVVDIKAATEKIREQIQNIE
ncbi:MAG: YicC family protein [Oscillospiraceae bacterium]|nr:YicC family protein [Oscillospiraceae bacterium]